MIRSPCSPRDSQESSPTPHFKSINPSVLRFLHSPTLTSIHDHWGNHSLTSRTLVGKVMSLLLNMLSRLVITFLPKSNRLLISWLQSPSAVILEPKELKSVIVSIVSPSIYHEVMGPYGTLSVVSSNSIRITSISCCSDICNPPHSHNRFSLRSFQDHFTPCWCLYGSKDQFIDCLYSSK